MAKLAEQIKALANDPSLKTAFDQASQKLTEKAKGRLNAAMVFKA